jgi:hypothetical protein
VSYYICQKHYTHGRPCMACERETLTDKAWVFMLQKYGQPGEKLPEKRWNSRLKFLVWFIGHITGGE